MAFPALFQFTELGGNMTFATIMVGLVGLVISALIFYFSRFGEFPQRSVSIFDLKQRNMVKIENPFVLSLLNNGKLKDGLAMSLSALCPSTVVVLWGPKINPFHEFILRPGSEIRSKCQQPEISLSDIDPLHIETRRCENPGKCNIILPCPKDFSSTTLGNRPRQRYPVAVLVFVSRTEGGTAGGDSSGRSWLNTEHPDCDSEHDDDVQRRYPENGEEPNSIAALITVIHLRDEIVPLDPHVIVQYVKTAGIPIYSLQPLFVPSSNNESQAQASDTLSEATSDSVNVKVKDAKQTNKRYSSQISGTLSSVLEPAEEYQRTRNKCDSEIEQSVGDLGASSTSCPDGMLINFNKDGREVEEDNNISPLTLDSDREGRNIIRKRLPARAPQTEGNESDDYARESTTQISSSGREGQSHSSSSFSGEPSDVEGRGKTEHFSECVVCQSRPALCVILPCRHTAVCLRCLRLLDRCPMCRGPIDSYFMLTGGNGEGGDLDAESEEEDELIEGMQRRAVVGNMTNMLEHLNEVLGFR